MWWCYAELQFDLRDRNAFLFEKDLSEGFDLRGKLALRLRVRLRIGE